MCTITVGKVTMDYCPETVALNFEFNVYLDEVDEAKRFRHRGI